MSLGQAIKSTFILCYISPMNNNIIGVQTKSQSL